MKFYKSVIILFLMLNGIVAQAQTWKIVRDKMDLGQGQVVEVVSEEGSLYLAFEDQAAKGFLSVRRYKSNKWEYVGQPGFSNGKAQNFAMTFKKEIPYIAYYDSNTDYIVVKKFDGKNWVRTGDNIPSAGKTSNIALKFGEGDNLFVAFSNEVKGHLSVQKLVNGTWENVGINLPAGRSMGKNIAMAVDSSRMLYLAYCDENYSNRIIVKKLHRNIWAPVGNFASEEEVASFSFAFDNDNTPHLLYTASKEQKIVFKKFHSDDRGGKWMNLNISDSSTLNSKSPSLVFNQNSLYVGYVNEYQSSCILKECKNGNCSDVSESGIYSSKKINQISLLSGNSGNLFMVLREAGKYVVLVQ